MAAIKTTLEAGEQNTQIALLKNRFEKLFGTESHWHWVEKKLLEKPQTLAILQEMEKTGGEPGVVKVVETTGEIWIFDTSPESPAGRRSLCYDPEALASRKENKPTNCAWGLANQMGITLLTEQDYRFLQQFGKFDQKTSSWIATPPDIRKAGGALFCDFRYSHVFVYHNGAESYYAARGFRGKIIF